ncbi:MAG: phosphatase PAP2 family protein [Flavobacteriales bacterium]|nr:phosphatase PAP2 family protein [Flavobacteriales bacterium]
MARLFLPLLILVHSYNSTFSQTAESPYNFNWKKDLIYASGCGLVAAGGILTRLQSRPLTETQINALDPYNIPGFDRPATQHWNKDAALASDILLYGSVTLPAFVMINKRARKDFLVIGFIYAETALLTLGVTELAKGLSKRPRPYVYNPDVPLDKKTERDARLSFFSGHTSMTAALCFTTAKVFSDYSDNPTHEALVWTAAAALPIATGFLRFEAGKHFPSDIIAGYFVGGAIGYLVPWLHRRKPLVKGLSWSPYSTGKNELGLYICYRL